MTNPVDRTRGLPGRSAPPLPPWSRAIHGQNARFALAIAPAGRAVANPTKTRSATASGRLIRSESKRSSAGEAGGFVEGQDDLTPPTVLAVRATAPTRIACPKYVARARHIAAACHVAMRRWR